MALRHTPIIEAIKSEIGSLGSRSMSQIAEAYGITKGALIGAVDRAGVFVFRQPADHHRLEKKPRPPRDHAPRKRPASRFGTPRSRSASGVGAAGQRTGAPRIRNAREVM